MSQANLHNPSVSVDCVVFGFDNDDLNVLIIRQKKIGKKVVQQYALPGDLLYKQEDLDEAAGRVLSELTSLQGIYLKQFHTFGAVDRVGKLKDRNWLREFREEPDARVITVAYYSLVRMQDYIPKASSFAGDAEWVKVDEVPQLAFDHNEILEVGLSAMRDELIAKNLAFELLPKKFTLSQIQRLYEIVLGKTLDKRNFRKKLKSMAELYALNEKQTGVLHKPAQLFSFKKH